MKKLRFDAFDSIPLATLHFAIWSHHKRLYFEKVLQTKKTRLPTGRSE